MMNADKIQRWRLDMTAAETSFHRWLRVSGQEAYRLARAAAAGEMHELMIRTDDLRVLTPKILRSSPVSVRQLRLSTAPPLALDRLVCLANSDRPTISAMEGGRLPTRISARELDAHLGRICAVIREFLDPDLFCWLDTNSGPTSAQRERASVVVADRQCDAGADRILRHARRNHQRQLMREWLAGREYLEQNQQPGHDITAMAPGTFYLGKILITPDTRSKEIPLDGAIRPHETGRTLLIKAVSGSDLAKSVQETKAAVNQQLLRLVPESATVVFLLAGAVNATYLRHLAGQGIDWVWEHRIEDLNMLVPDRATPHALPAMQP